MTPETRLNIKVEATHQNMESGCTKYVESKMGGKNKQEVLG